jgi:uncharacterized phage protein gp47/JayE
MTTTLPIPTLEEMRDQQLEDYEYAAIDAGVDTPPIGVGSDWYARATANANLMTIALDKISAAENDCDPRTCSDERVEEWRITMGLPIVVPTGSTGRIVARLTGTTASVLDGQQLQRNGYTYHVVGNWIAIADSSEIECWATDTGSDTDAEGGEFLTWYPSAPPGFKSEADVSNTTPLTGGTDAETPERKRDRIVDAWSSPASGGNWAHIRQLAVNSGTTVAAYVYPALGGPGSCKTVCTKPIDPGNRDWSRAPTSAMLTRVRAAIWGEATEKQVVVATNLDPTSMTLQLDIPDATSAGGNGMGWLNAAPWPTLVVADAGRVSVGVVTNSKSIRVTAQTTVAPVDGQTYVSWWSPGDQRFYQRLVISHSGSAGLWVLGLDEPCVDEDNVLIAVGDFISPAAANLAAYGDKWREIMGTLGPGENTTDAYRIPRAARHPATSAEDSPDLNAVQKKTFQNFFSEVADIDYGYRSKSTPTVPGSVDTAPYTLTLDDFGIYPI